MFVLVKLEKIFCLFIFLACTPWVYSAKSIPDYYFGFTSTVSKARTYLLHISNDGNSIAFGKKICFQLYRFYSAKYWSDWKIAHQEIKQIPYNNELALVIRISINNGLMPKYCRWGGDYAFECLDKLFQELMMNCFNVNFWFQPELTLFDLTIWC